MAISREQLRQALAGARNVIQNDPITTPTPAAARMQENAGRRYVNNSGVEYVDTDTELTYDDPYGYGGQQQAPQGQAAVRNSRMPDAIKQSMLEEEIDVSSLQEGSILDNLGVPKATRRPQRRVVNESVSAQYQEVDYGLIKKIIEECLDERLNDLTLNTIRLQEGKIRLVDNSGRIFAATLEYKGNVADKKKK